VPANSRVVSISLASFTVDQALLTGESYSVSNLTGVVQDEKAVKQDMVNMLFSGTTVVTGKAQALVVATGTQTAISDIHTSITSQTSEKTPLKQKVRRLRRAARHGYRRHLCPRLGRQLPKLERPVARQSSSERQSAPTFETSSLLA
ncbi:E1-E2 ATPase-domain containing protein, partial [Rhodotorula toruloides]